MFDRSTIAHLIIPTSRRLTHELLPSRCYYDDYYNCVVVIIIIRCIFDCCHTVMETMRATDSTNFIVRTIILLLSLVERTTKRERE